MTCRDCCQHKWVIDFTANNGLGRKYVICYKCGLRDEIISQNLTTQDKEVQDERQR